jgi:hypothetical protein
MPPKKESGKKESHGKESPKKRSRKSVRSEDANLSSLFEQITEGHGEKCQVSAEVKEKFKELKQEIYSKFAQTMSSLIQLSGRKRISPKSLNYKSDIELAFGIMLSKGPLKDEVLSKIERMGDDILTKKKFDRTISARSIGFTLQPGFAVAALKSVPEANQVGSGCVQELLEAVQTILAAVFSRALHFRKQKLVGEDVQSYVEEKDSHKTMNLSHIRQSITSLPELKGLFFSIIFPYTVKHLDDDQLNLSSFVKVNKKSKRSAIKKEEREARNDEQGSSSKKSKSEKSSTKKEPVKKESVKKEPVKKEPVKKEPVKKESVKKESVKKESVKKESVEKAAKKKSKPSKKKKTPK